MIECQRAEALLVSPTVFDALGSEMFFPRTSNSVENQLTDAVHFLTIQAC